MRVYRLVLALAAAAVVSAPAFPTLAQPGSPAGDRQPVRPAAPQKPTDKKNPELAPTTPEKPAPDGGSGGPKKAKDGVRIDLRPKWRQGSVTKFKIDSTATSKPRLEGMDELGRADQTMDHQMVLALTVKQVQEDGSATVEAKIVSLKMHVAAGGDDVITFDSSKPASKDDQTGASMRGSVGAPFTIELDSQGNISKVTGADMLAGPLAEQLGSPDAAKNMLGPIFTRSAGDGMAAVGETWMNEDEMSMGPMGGMKMTTEHKLVSARGGKAVVTITGKLESQSEGMEAALKITESKYDGRYVWDTELGMLDEMTMTQGLTMSGEMQGAKMSQSVQSTHKMKRVE
ncbi:MAG: hypothetical protein H7Y88_06545 [Phycisphaerales bacterium]|nr:hypothetical protein [Phycisphaerales bacterium]